MITVCQMCSAGADAPTKTRHIDASVYAGDYHSPPRDEDYAAGRQCVECGAVSEVFRVGRTVRMEFRCLRNIPPRRMWIEPRR